MLFASTVLPQADTGVYGDDNFLQRVQVTRWEVALVLATWLNKENYHNCQVLWM